MNVLETFKNPWVLGGGVALAIVLSIVGGRGQSGGGQAGPAYVDPRLSVDLQIARARIDGDVAIAAYDAARYNYQAQQETARAVAQSTAGIVTSAQSSISNVTIAAYGASAQIENTRSRAAADFGIAQVNAWRDITVADIGRRTTEEVTKQGTLNKILELGTSIITGRPAS